MIISNRDESVAVSYCTMLRKVCDMCQFVICLLKKMQFMLYILNIYYYFCTDYKTLDLWKKQ